MIGDPIGTVSGSDQAQPEDAYEGTRCIFTAQNSSLGVDDVDGGVVYLVSPIIDLSDADSAELEYVRWFYNRDMGEDSGDFFVAQVSDDNGTNWVALETLDTSQSANTWASKVYTLGSYITLTNTVRVRFGAADGPSLGNIIEAALDNVKVWAYGGCETNEDCDDALFCNGAEICIDGSCQAGTPPDCDDGVSCTDDSCNEGNDSCDHTPNDSLCDNTLFCDGAETCDAVNDCQPGMAPDCDDGVGCTDDSCNEGTDSCDHTPNDSLCDNTLFCDGAETCDALLDCQAGSDPCDGLACDEENDICVCGNGICEESYGEDCSTCPQDCPGDGFKGECCGNENCEKFEEKRGTCPEDCS
ncbi:MAG: hypothetical protein ACFFCW_24195 [Candidatus Hodarchaeota archaeon]